MAVSIQDYNGEIVSFFITKELQLTTLISNLTYGDNIVYLTNGTNCLAGDAIDIYDNQKYFQGLITSVSGNNITFTPSVDYNYSTTDTNIKCGEWNLNADGSVIPQEFYIIPPSNKAWDIESFGMQFIDTADWDINTFGSQPALSNGFVVSVGDGSRKELFLIYNNGGFTLRGGVVQGFEKAPSGSYGFSVDMNFEDRYGSILKLDGTQDDKLTAIVADDLSAQDQIAFVVRGHYKDE